MLLDELLKFGAFLVATLGVVLGLHRHLSNRLDDTNKEIGDQVASRTETLNVMRTNYDARFAACSQRDAELSERITAMKLEAFRELGSYVTRAEFDKRMERLESGQYIQNAKLDTIIERISRVI